MDIDLQYMYMPVRLVVVVVERVSRLNAVIVVQYVPT